MSTKPENSAGDSAATVIPSHGKGKLLPGGKKGNKGGHGRTPDEFKRHMVKLVNREEVQAYLERCIKGEYGPKVFQRAVEYATDRAYGKASQPMEVTGADGTPLFKAFVGVDPDKV